MAKRRNNLPKMDKTFLDLFKRFYRDKDLSVPKALAKASLEWRKEKKKEL